jgi:uncharacterized damage-inducible protein DinB
MNDAAFRKNLVELLKGGSAHLPIEKVLADLEPEERAVKPDGFEHSIWDLLEHMRIAQEDILQYTLNPNYQSPAWPDNYWPPETEEVSDRKWKKSVEAFFEDLRMVIDLAMNEQKDLTEEIPHGEGRTYLRQLFLVADHNSYHLGQIVQLKKIVRAEN